MANEQMMELSIWDKLIDGFSAFSEGCSHLITRVFGSSNERYIRKMGYLRTWDLHNPYKVIPGSLLAQVNALEERMHSLSGEELKALTLDFRERLAQGATLDDLLPEAFAACREAAFRAKNMRHFDVQILGGIVLHRGNIAEMVTGEGKTLVATLPAYLNALTGKGVHVVTVNDYLARRDCEWMLPIYQALGITAGFIQSDMDPVDRRRAYDCDITYGTNSEFGFDYLRDNMKPARWGDMNYDPWYQQCQKALNFAIIDEVDNILIDEARTPLIISGPAFGDLRRYARANDVALQLSGLQKQEPGRYFEVKEKEHTCHLTDEGIHKAEELAQVESFYTAGNMEWPHLIDNALKAHHLYHKDKRYVVMRHPESNEMSIIIVDEFTGRLMIGRQWSDGLHQAVEAKHAREGVVIKEETQTLATITLQNFFKLYKKLAGMTGTAMTEANEFWKIYKLDVIAIPTNQSLIRVNHPDVIFRFEREKWEAVVDEIVEVHEEGRPMLIGTTDVDKSEKLSGMLSRRGVKHELLNAKPEYAAREAEIVAQAGRIGGVTIATNMAGRGTDIILGGNPETLAWARLKNTYATRLDVPEDEWKQTVAEIESKDKMKEEGRRVAEMGGLHIVGTERHEARRIDNQLRGRAGRQGDPGSSRFFLSLEDDLMRIFAGEFVQKALTWMGMEDGQAIESRMVSRRIEGAQKKVEERNFDSRKSLLEYDEVMDHQRKRVYGYRQEILEGANCKIRILGMIDEQIDLAVDRFLNEDYGSATFAEFASGRLGVEFDASDFSRSDFEEAERTARDKAIRMIPTQIHEAMEENLSTDVETSEWNWQAMAQQINSRWGLKTTDRQLKQIGRDNLAQHLIDKAEQAVAEVDISASQPFLDPTWGRRSIADWARTKFHIKIEPESLDGKEPEEIKELLRTQVRALYRQKEIEFPVRVGMARFMTDRTVQGSTGHRYDRDGLLQWARRRFGGEQESEIRNQESGVRGQESEVRSQRSGVRSLVSRDVESSERSAAVGSQESEGNPTGGGPWESEAGSDRQVEGNGQQSHHPKPAGVVPSDFREADFLTQSRSRLQELLLEASRKFFPEVEQEEIDRKIAETLHGTRLSEEEDARELVEWAKAELKVEVPAAVLTGVTEESARQILWNAFDERYRPEMHRMERSLLLGRLDGSWKNHLYTMDHLRAGIGLVGYAQVDPKTEYKRQGMKEFDNMWETVRDKVTDTVFRMEEEEGFQESLWAIGSAVHEAAPRAALSEQNMRGQQDQAITNSQQSNKKVEPIRNRGQRVGRNDPCPCGSGKKYKNCHMRQGVT